jgi:hypothetical protein
MAAKEGPNVLFYMPNRTKCIALVSVTPPRLLSHTWGALSPAGRRLVAVSASPPVTALGPSLAPHFPPFGKLTTL